MSGFVNPFAQVGDYQDQRAVSNDLVTTSYLTGLPDPRQIQDQHVALMFRTLLKRDTRTKQRALGEFEQWVTGLASEVAVEDQVHLAYVQMYAKLSIDVAPLIRVQSHTVLAKLYSVLGKRSSKYLKYSVGPWVAGTNDPDPRAASAAKDALAQVFPGEKQTALLQKMKGSILDFVYDSCVNATAQTLSDERYVSKEDMSQKYTRLVKCSVDVISRIPGMFDLASETVHSLVSTGKLWKFYSSSDSALAKSTLQLTATHSSDLEPYVGSIWSELLRAGRKNSGGSGVAIVIIQLMNVFTKKYPAITWPDDAAVRKDAMGSLAQFVSADPPHPTRFWPLLYNLVLMIPGSPAEDAAPLYKPLEKVVLRIKHDAELERSAWGCFISLAGKMGPTYVARAFKAAEQRSKGKAVPIEILATFLSRVATASGISELVYSQLEDTKVPFTYCLVIARTRLFRKDIETLIVPTVESEQLLMLVEADPDLAFGVDDVGSSPIWVSIAAKSHTVNSQEIIDKAVRAGYIQEILEAAPSLHKRGVTLSLDATVHALPSSERTASLLSAVIGAEGTFVSREIAATSLKELIHRAADEEENTKTLFRVIRAHQDAVDTLVSMDVEIRHGLEALRPDDKLGVLNRLSAMKEIATSNEDDYVGPSSARYLESIDLDALDLSVPLLIVSSIRAEVPLIARPFEEALLAAENLLSKLIVPIDIELSAENTAKLHVLRSFSQSWVAAISKTKASPIMDFLHATNSLFGHHDNSSKVSRPVWQYLWNASGSATYTTAYHAAVALTSPLWTDLFSSELYEKEKEGFMRLTLKGALLASHHAGKDSPDYESIQRRLIYRALTHNLDKREWMLIDRSYIPSSSTFSLKAQELESAELTSIILETLPHIEQRIELAVSSSNVLVQMSALNGLTAGEVDSAILQDAASAFPIERTNFDKERSWAVLQKLANVQQAHSKESLNWDTIQKLLSRSDSDFLPWLALLASKSVGSSELTLRLEPISGVPTRADIVRWLIYLNYPPEAQSPASYEVHSRILDFVARGLRHNGALADSAHLQKPRSIPVFDFKSGDCDGNLLFKICANHGNDFREWYRNLRDKQTQKLMDTALAAYIVPELLSSLKDEIEETPRSDGAEVSVNRRQREIRATREIEDQFTVEIVIGLPEQYPGKPAVIEIRNLAGVSEAKKRGWLLEARQTVQSEGVLKALGGILNRLNNFLDGVEPCAICYMTVNDANKLPNKECSHCHNIYHSDCLFKWFQTNSEKLCPMCRAPM